MNEIVTQFLLAGYRFMPEIYKKKERIQRSKETGDSRYIYTQTNY